MVGRHLGTGKAARGVGFFQGGVAGECGGVVLHQAPVQPHKGAVVRCEHLINGPLVLLPGVGPGQRGGVPGFHGRVGGFHAVMAGSHGVVVGHEPGVAANVLE